MDIVPDIDDFDLDPGSDLRYDQDEEEQMEINENRATIPPTSAINALNQVGERRSNSVVIRKPEDFPPDNVFVHPIDWHMRFPDYSELSALHRAKERARKEAVDRLANKIEELRTRKETQKNTDNDGINSDIHFEPMVSDVDTICKAEILYEPPSDGTPWIGISTACNTRRLYIRKIPKNYNSPKEKSINRTNTGIFEANTLNKLILEANALRAKKLPSESSHSILPESSLQSNNKTPEGSLWVDRYRPKTFLDLLSEDSVNRNVLTWVKLWDECVFNQSALSHLTHIRDKEKVLLETEAEKPHRPKHKILLLSGSAGVGKTTLATVIAQQAGYDIVHVNASDSRNVSDLEKLLRSVSETKRTINGTKRPQILLLDEIDGAPADAINWLSKAITATGKKALRRPIIAICNTLYSSNLRELRQHAAVILVNHPHETILAGRLEKIANQEDVLIDRHCIEKLIECTEGDIRLSINTLQFLSRITNRDEFIGEDDVIKACQQNSLGNSNLFEQWAKFLDLNRHYDKRGIIMSESTRLVTVEKAWMMAGDQRERFVLGLHHNYTRHHPANSFSKISQASQCFVFYDSINRVIQEKQNYGLSRYFYSFYSPLHLLLTTHSKIQLVYPQNDATAKMKANEECLRSIRANTLESYRLPLILEVLPLALVITQPTFKQANVSLISHTERRALSNIVQILVQFGITFKAFSVRDQIQWLYDPLIDGICLFELPNKSKVVLNNAYREEIARLMRQKHVLLDELNTGSAMIMDMDKENIETPSINKETRKRRWRDFTTETTPKIIKSISSANKTKGITFAYKLTPLNAVKTKVSLGQFLSH